jgi:predicted DNA-binding transcriptional regulator AlpA
MSKLLTLTEAGGRLRKSPAAMRWMRHQNVGPQSAIIGGRVMFREEDIDAWIDAQFAEQAS